MVDLDTALGEEFFDGAQGRPKGLVAADRNDEEVGREWKPAKA